jgi:hypothetical protein
LETYKKEHTVLKERVDRELNGYNLEIQIKKADLEIKEMVAKNQEMKRNNQSLMKYKEKMHSVNHHRVTLDDDSQYTMSYKHNRKVLDLMNAKTD